MALAINLANLLALNYSEKRGVERYLSPESGRSTTIVLPLFSSLSARIAAALRAAAEGPLDLLHPASARTHIADIAKSAIFFIKLYSFFINLRRKTGKLPNYL